MGAAKWGAGLDEHVHGSRPLSPEGNSHFVVVMSAHDLLAFVVHCNRVKPLLRAAVDQPRVVSGNVQAAESCHKGLSHEVTHGLWGRGEENKEILTLSCISDQL